MNLASVLVLLAVAAAFTAVVISRIKAKKAGETCCGGCSGCSMKGICHSENAE